jgi:transcriptional regulator with XRE-family HTH domain
MHEKKIHEAEIKRKIKDLISASGEKKTKLSMRIGYSPNFLNSILGNEKSFFNITHIYKICAALDYPVAKLFEDDVCSQEEQAVPATGQEEVLLKIYRGLSSTHKLDVVGFAGERRLAEAQPPKASKKAIAAA